MKFLTLTLVAVVMILIGGVTQSQASGTVVSQCPTVVEGVNFYQHATWKWQDKMDVSLTRSNFKPNRILSCNYANWVGSLWRHRSMKWHKKYIEYKKAHTLTRPPHYSDWLCIHRGEGSWTANTGNGYYGGLQMDHTFMRHYGPSLLASKGTADRWTPLEQMWVAENALNQGRGFYPWPNTARACGLI